MSRERHVPIRTCMGCGARAPQPVLLRLRRSTRGTLTQAIPPDTQGRSGYLHLRRECWDQFASRKGRIRSLGCSLDRAQRVACLSELEHVFSAIR